MTYVLILVLYSYMGGGSPATAEFNTKEACEAAIAVVRSGTQTVRVAACVPKGRPA